MLEIPMLSADLIELLDKVTPKATLTQGDFNKAERQLWFEAGQRSVVESLKFSLQAQIDSNESTHPLKGVNTT